MRKTEKTRMLVLGGMYWFLFIYIISALVFWYTALEKQNIQMTDYRLNELKLDDPDYETLRFKIEDEKRRKSTQYLGEGLTFLAITLLGTFFVYRAIRRQLNFQQQQQNFMMAITHELKTPIAVAKLNLETLQKHQLPEEKKQKLIHNTLIEANRLNGLTNNILVSAQLESDRYRSTTDRIDLSNLFDMAVGDFEERFPERVWRVSIEDDIYVKGDMLLLQILVNNIIENAVKYSPKNTVIECILNREGKHAIIRIIDEGAGIPAVEKQKIFEKFYRIGNESTRTAQGTGLGLYLCKKIAKEHKGSIRVLDHSPRGTNFVISLPIDHSL